MAHHIESDDPNAEIIDAPFDIDQACPRCGGCIQTGYDIALVDGSPMAEGYVDHCPHCHCEISVDIIWSAVIAAQSRYEPMTWNDAEGEEVHAMYAYSQASDAYKALGDRLLSEQEWHDWFVKEFGNQWNYSYQMLDPACISLEDFINENMPEYIWMFDKQKPKTWDDIPDGVRVPFKCEIIKDLQGRGWEVQVPSDYTLEMAIEDWKNQCGEDEIVKHIVDTRFAIY